MWPSLRRSHILYSAGGRRGSHASNLFGILDQDTILRVAPSCPDLLRVNSTSKLSGDAPAVGICREIRKGREKVTSISLDDASGKVKLLLSDGGEVPIPKKEVAFFLKNMKFGNLRSVELSSGEVVDTILRTATGKVKRHFQYPSELDFLLLSTLPSITCLNVAVPNGAAATRKGDEIVEWFCKMVDMQSVTRIDYLTFRLTLSPRGIRSLFHALRSGKLVVDTLSLALDLEKKDIHELCSILKEKLSTVKLHVASNLHDRLRSALAKEKDTEGLMKSLSKHMYEENPEFDVDILLRKHNQRRAFRSMTRMR